jgi:hypothetical protein
MMTTDPQAPGWPFPAKVAFAGFLAIALNYFSYGRNTAHISSPTGRTSLSWPAR